MSVLIIKKLVKAKCLVREMFTGFKSPPVHIVV